MMISKNLLMWACSWAESEQGDEILQAVIFTVWEAARNNYMESIPWSKNWKCRTNLLDCKPKWSRQKERASVPYLFMVSCQFILVSLVSTHFSFNFSLSSFPLAVFIYLTLDFSCFLYCFSHCQESSGHPRAFYSECLSVTLIV